MFGTFQAKASVVSCCSGPLASGSLMLVAPPFRFVPHARTGTGQGLGDQIGAVRCHHRSRHETAHAGRLTVGGGAQLGDAVDLGPLVGGAALDEAVLDAFDEHAHRLADPFGGALVDELVDEIGDTPVAGRDPVLVEVPVEPLGRGALLVRVAEDPGDVEAGPREEVGEDVDVLLGLAGEADDDVGADAGPGGALADAPDEPEEALGVAARRGRRAGS